MNTYELVWSPTGQYIATVSARTPRSAIRKAPKPYRRYLGEIYTKELAKEGEAGKLAREDSPC